MLFVLDEVLFCPRTSFIPLFPHVIASSRYCPRFICFVLAPVFIPFFYYVFSPSQLFDLDSLLCPRICLYAPIALFYCFFIAFVFVHVLMPLCTYVLSLFWLSLLCGCFVLLCLSLCPSTLVFHLHTVLFAPRFLRTFLCFEFVVVLSSHLSVCPNFLIIWSLLTVCPRRITAFFLAPFLMSLPLYILGIFLFVVLTIRVPDMLVKDHYWWLMTGLRPVLRCFVISSFFYSTGKSIELVTVTTVLLIYSSVLWGNIVCFVSFFNPGREVYATAIGAVSVIVDTQGKYSCMRVDSCCFFVF